MTGVARVGSQAAEHYRAPRPGNTFAMTGDSISQAGLGVPYAFGDNFGVYACAMSGGRLTPVGFYCIPGQQTPQISSRIGQALLKRPAFLSILAGTNDMGQVLYGLLTRQQCVQQVTRNLLGMYHAALDAGTIPIACTITPSKGNGFTTAQGMQRRALICTVNEWIVTTAQRLGIPCADFYSVLVDSGISPGVDAGNWLNIATNSTDGIHPTAEAALTMGTELYRAVSGSLPPTPPPWAKDLVDNQISAYTPTWPRINLTANPLWQGNVGSPGVRPDSWTVTGAATFTSTLGADPQAKMAGNVFTVAVTGGAAGSQGGITYGANANTVSNINVGDLVRFRGRFRKDTGVGVQVQVWIGSQATRYTPLVLTAAGAAITDGAWDFTFRAPQSGGFNANVFARYQTGAGSVVFGQVSAMNLTAAGLDDADLAGYVPDLIVA